jgi:hypothetical protein
MEKTPTGTKGRRGKTSPGRKLNGKNANKDKMSKRRKRRLEKTLNGRNADRKWLNPYSP